MKALLALALFSTLFASNAFAAHACIVSTGTGYIGVHQDDYRYQIYVNCDGANKETRTINMKKDVVPTDLNISTVIADLATKGYKVVAFGNERWTLVNDAQ